MVKGGNNNDSRNFKKNIKNNWYIFVISSIISIGFGAFMTYSGGFAATNMPEVKDHPDYQLVTGFFLVAGIAFIIGGIIHMLQGIFSVKAAKDSKYGNKAYIFSILGLISTIASAIATLFAKNNTVSTYIGQVGGLILGVLVLIAAKKVKEDYKA